MVGGQLVYRLDDDDVCSSRFVAVSVVPAFFSLDIEVCVYE